MLKLTVGNLQMDLSDAPAIPVAFTPKGGVKVERKVDFADMIEMKDGKATCGPAVIGPKQIRELIPNITPKAVEHLRNQAGQRLEARMIKLATTLQDSANYTGNRTVFAKSGNRVSLTWRAAKPVKAGAVDGAKVKALEDENAQLKERLEALEALESKLKALKG